MGVVYYGNYLVYFERARNQLLRDLGVPYPLVEERGYALPVIEAHVYYRASATYEDVLELRGWIGWLKRARLRVDCAVYCGDKLLCEGYTVHAFVEKDTHRPVRIMDELVAACKGSDR